MGRSLILSGACAAFAMAGCSSGVAQAPLAGNAASATAAPNLLAASGAAAPVVAQPDDDYLYALATGQIRPSCSAPSSTTASCHAYVRTDVSSATLPAGYGPAQLQAAYGFSSAVGRAGGLVAIVDAYDDPNAEADQTKYRAAFGLPACTSASGCFAKVNESGVVANYPAPSSSWAQEISLDLDMVAANCPKCRVLLVEAVSSSLADMGQSVNTAVKRGAVAVSNSYGGPEAASDATYLPYYNHPGVAIVASSGDKGYGVNTPASYGTVIAVGGTTLRAASNARGYGESVWNGSGSGCSAYEAKPSWQISPGCAKRSVADLAYDADPNTGVAVYDSYQAAGFLVFGGTSVAAPAIAALYALAGSSKTAQSLYASPSALYDIVSGTNGKCATYLCTAVAGYDGPTGNGTPDGLGAL